MKKVKNNLIFIFECIFAFILCVLLFNVIFLNNSTVYTCKWFIVLLGVILGIGLLYFLRNKIKNIDEKKHKIIIPIVIVISILIQGFVGFLFAQNPTWDFGAVYDSAKFAVDNGIRENLLSNYLYSAPNNIPLAMILAIVFKVAKVFGCSNYFIVGIVLNIIMIQLACILTYFTASKIYGKKNGLLVYFMIMAFTPIYFYVPIFYTDTLTMWIPVLMFYLYLNINKDNSKKKNIILCVLLGIVTGIGFLIKFTPIILLVAMFIYEILKNNFKEYIKKFAIILIAFIMTYAIYNVGLKVVFKLDKKRLEEEKVLPVTYFIRTGLSKYGCFNDEDFGDQYNYNTIEERNEANIAKIKERMSNYGFFGYINFIRFKMDWTLSDGTYFAANKLQRSPMNQGNQYEFINSTGKYTWIYKYYAQISHVIIWTLLVGTVLYFVRNKKTDDKIIVLMIAVFGLLSYLLISETRSRYLVNYIPIFIIMAFYILNKFNFKKGEKNEKHISNRSCRVYWSKLRGVFCK